MGKIVKILLIFWGIILVSIVLKFLTSYLPNKIDFSLPNYFKTNSTSESLKTTEKDKNIIYFPLEKQYGLRLEGYKGCTKNYSSGQYEQGFNVSTTSSCVNGECSINVAFQQAIPKKIKLYVERNNNCHLKEFEIPQNPDVIGYYVNLQLSQAQKDYLGITDGNKIRLGNAKGYSLYGDTKLYFYNSQRDKDDIVVNDTIVGKVFFNKNSIQLQTIKSPILKVENETEMAIPTPAKLYTYTCNSHFACTREANTYIVNVDGIDFIPSKAFVYTCLRNRQVNKFCAFMTSIGDTKSIKFDSKAIMDSYIDKSKNPEFDDTLKEWEKERFEKAKQKIKNSLL